MTRKADFYTYRRVAGCGDPRRHSPACGGISMKTIPPQIEPMMRRWQRYEKSIRSRYSVLKWGSSKCRIFEAGKLSWNIGSGESETDQKTCRGTGTFTHQEKYVNHGELSGAGIPGEVKPPAAHRGLSGISLLGLQDFPGQGTALGGYDELPYGTEALSLRQTGAVPGVFHREPYFCENAPLYL